MIFKEKLLAGALALVLGSASGGAFATVAAGADGDSDLLLFVWNDTDGAGVGANAGPAYVRDLGINWSDINGNLSVWNATGTTFDKTDAGFEGFAGGNVFSSLFSGAALNSLRWGIFAANDFGGPSGGSTVFSTIKGSPAAITGPGAGTSAGQFGDLASIVNIPGQQAGNEYTLPVSGSNWIGQQPSTKWGNNAGGAFPASFTTGLGIDDTLNFYTIEDTGAPAARKTQFGTLPGFPGTWSIASNGDVTYMVPVPEPSTYALMALGLVGVAAMARSRRKA
jgi:hypothetical protein